MRLLNFLDESRNSATLMEVAVVEVWNSGSTQYKNLERTAKSICNFLKQKGISGDAIHMGRGKIPLSSDWSKYGGTDNTPKADIIIGNYKISMKKKGGSQLVSGERGEALSLFYSVAEKMNIYDEISKLFDDDLRNLLTGELVDPDQTVTKIFQQRKNKTVMNAGNSHFRLTKKLSNYVNNNIKFKREVVREALTGNNKFGKSSQGSANYALSWTMGDEHYFYSCDHDGLINTLTKKTEFEISFKTKLTRDKLFRRISSNLRLILPKEHKENINENMIQTIISKLKTFWNGFNNSVYNLLTFLGFELDMSIKINF